MSRLARFLSENFFNDIMFPDHALSSTGGNVTGNEVWRVGTGRRMNVRNKWTPSSFNTEASIVVDCGAAKAADMVVIDRGSNLLGENVILEHDDNSGFTTPTVVINATIPTTVTTDDDLSATPGVLTEEGAWMYQFAEVTERYWRLRIPALGVGLRPEIVGFYLGSSYEPNYHLDLPYEDELGESLFDEVISDTAWSASTRVASRRKGTVRLRLSDDAEYTTARLQIRQRFMKNRRPMWIVFNQEAAERAVLAMHAAGEWGFTRADGWSFRQAAFPWVEHQPALNT